LIQNWPVDLTDNSNGLPKALETACNEVSRRKIGKCPYIDFRHWPTPEHSQGQKKDPAEARPLLLSMK
jgi:hypothetical protein